MPINFLFLIHKVGAHFFPAGVNALAGILQAGGGDAAENWHPERADYLNIARRETYPRRVRKKARSKAAASSRRGPDATSMV